MRPLESMRTPTESNALSVNCAVNREESVRGTMKPGFSPLQYRRLVRLRGIHGFTSVLLLGMGTEQL